MRHDLSLPVHPPATLAEVLTRLEARIDLAPTTRRDLLSAVRAVARFAGLPPGTVSTDVRRLRQIFESVQPGQFRMTRRRLANIRSLFARALVITGAPIEPLRLDVELSPAWAALRASLSEHGRWNAITRFSQWATLQGIPPGDVSDATIAAHAAALETGSLVLRPREHVQDLVRAWNSAADTVPAWPKTRLTQLRRREIFLLPPSTFPESFTADLEGWRDRLSGKDPLAETFCRPLRPASIDCYCQTLRRTASILVHLGRDPITITDLACLVDLDAAKQVFRWHLARHGDRASQQTHLLGAILLAVARHWVGLGDGDLQRLESLCARVRVRSEGMTQKNRNTLRLFEDECLVHGLLSLPGRLMRRALSGATVDWRDAYGAAVALAIEILICAPVRIENLHAIELDRHIVRCGTGRRGEVLLSFPAHEVKNNKAIEYPLSAEASRLLDLYLERAWPVLAEPGCRHLFPGRAGTKRSKIGLGMSIARTTERELGVRVTAHQFRHVCGYLYLSVFPGEYETVRGLLGHKSLQTTVQFYAGMETAEAGRRFAEVVLDPRRPRRPHR